jgi:hypothetical protein
MTGRFCGISDMDGRIISKCEPIHLVLDTYQEYLKDYSPKS